MVDRSVFLGVALTMLAVPFAAAPAAAQDATAQSVDGAPATIVNANEPRLIFEREVFAYPGRARRDPFMPLTGANAGPLFSDLKLHVILFDANPGESIAAVSDASGKQYRLRRGDSVGNATVVDIGKTRVVFSVSDFGIRRQEVLDMKAKREGA